MFTGTLRHNDLEGGFFELVTENGDVYRLEGDGPFDAGARVTVHGNKRAAGFGIHMVSAPVIEVARVEAAG